MIDGQDLPAFREIVLAESWVTDVVARPRSLVVLLDAVIARSSPRLRQPRPGEVFSHLPVEVRFLGVTAVHWTDHAGPTLDPDGTIDTATSTPCRSTATATSSRPVRASSMSRPRRSP